MNFNTLDMFQTIVTLIDAKIMPSLANGSIFKLASVSFLYDSVVFLKHFLFFIYFWVCEREREHTCMSGGGAEREREGDTESEAGSRPWAPNCQGRAQCRAWTHGLWDHDLSWSQLLNWLSHSGAPFVVFYNILHAGMISCSGLILEGFLHQLGN